MEPVVAASAPSVPGKVESEKTQGLLSRMHGYDSPVPLYCEEVKKAHLVWCRTAHRYTYQLPFFFWVLQAH